MPKKYKENVTSDSELWGSVNLDDFACRN